MTRLCEIIYVKSEKGWKFRLLPAEGMPVPKPSDETYELFYDCVSAARKRGYTENIKCL
ncbi:MAG TPA: hypothetical protein VEB41_09215 [Burkholderiales bacterium]|nr:hypothetical protein [Burkholderiales bacterium]